MVLWHSSFDVAAIGAVNPGSLVDGAGLWHDSNFSLWGTIIVRRKACNQNKIGEIK